MSWLVLLAVQSTTTAPSLSEDDLLFPEIPSVYAASKYEQRTADAPASVTVITADEIELFGYSTIGELLQSVRSFYISNDRNYSFVGARGFQRPGDYNTRILLLIDGHRTNDAVYDGALVGGEAYVEVKDIERVEIVRGPSSSIYGTSAFFAVINVITKRGRDLMGVEVAGGAASYNGVRGRLALGHRLADLEYYVSGAFSDTGGQNLYFEEFDSPLTNGGIAQDLDYEKSARLLPKITYRQFTLQGAFSWRKKGVPTASFEQVFNDPRSQTTEQYWYLELRYADTFADLVDLNAKVFLDDYHYDGNYIYDYSDAGDGSFIVDNTEYGDGRWWGGEVTGSISILEDHKLTLGVELRHNLQQDQGAFDQISAWEERHDSVVVGAYAQAEVRPLSSLLLSAGVRYDHYSSFGGTLNPRAAVIWQPLDITTIKLIFGQSFRAPNEYELHYRNGGFIKSADSLDPEKIRTYELVLEQAIGQYVRATASGFFYEVTGLINLAIDEDDGLVAFQNLEENRAIGFEAEVETKWPEVIEGRLSYSLQRVWDPETDLRLTSSPMHLVKLNLGVPILGEALKAGLEIQYVSNMITVDGTPSDGFAVLNLSLLSKEVVDRLAISFHVYNLFNAEYGFPGSVEHTQRVIFQDGRTWRLNATWAF